MSNKFNKTMLELLAEWFTNRSQLANYDFEMLKNLAYISINGSYKKPKSNDEDIPKDI